MKSITKSDKETAMYLALIIRDNLEDFHVKNIPDSKMKELNTIIRNSLLQCLHMAKNPDHPAVQFLSSMAHASIPTYWEQPELPEDYKMALKHKNVPTWDSIFKSAQTVSDSHLRHDDNVNENKKRKGRRSR